MEKLWTANNKPNGITFLDFESRGDVIEYLDEWFSDYCQESIFLHLKDGETYSMRFEVSEYHYDDDLNPVVTHTEEYKSVFEYRDVYYNENFNNIDLL